MKASELPNLSLRVAATIDANGDATSEPTVYVVDNRGHVIGMLKPIHEVSWDKIGTNGWFFDIVLATTGDVVTIEE